jgi:carbonic anhydrase
MSCYINMSDQIKQIVSDNVKATNSIDCESATSPVNISMDKIMGPCVLKCDYNYTYNVYSPNITNKKSYLSLNYSGNYNPVNYNDEKYNVQEIRIYQPSLHQYKNIKADGEIFIIHNGPGKNLIVSIPFIVGSKTDKGSSQLTSMINEAATRIPNSNESVTLTQGDFSLSNFIPNRKGYFSYKGTLPYEPCNGTYNYIVYNIDDALNIPQDKLDQLKKIIDFTECKINDNDVFYNKNGANSKNSNDDIYIDCQPVDADGNILVDMNDRDDKNDLTFNIDFDKIKPFLYVLLGLLIGYILIYIGKYVFDVHGPNTTATSQVKVSSSK